MQGFNQLHLRNGASVQIRARDGRHPLMGNSHGIGVQLDQLQLMLFDGLSLRPALFGLGLGVLLSFAATRIFQSMHFGTRPLDPVVLSGVIATLLAVAVLASLAPAWPLLRSIQCKCSEPIGPSIIRPRTCKPRGLPTVGAQIASRVSGRWTEKLDIVPLPDILQSIETISFEKKMHGCCSTCY